MPERKKSNRPAKQPPEQISGARPVFAVSAMAGCVPREAVHIDTNGKVSIIVRDLDFDALESAAGLPFPPDARERITQAAGAFLSELAFDAARPKSGAVQTDLCAIRE